MKRILVVDDAATVRMYHRKILSDMGWSVDEAVNGLEALEKVMDSAPPSADKSQGAGAGTGPFDLYVVDINMPRMDGYSFVRELRKLRGVTAAPVLMVSTESQTEDGVLAEEAGANAYLIKPAHPAQLVLSAALLMGETELLQALTLPTAVETTA